MRTAVDLERWASGVRQFSRQDLHSGQRAMKPVEWKTYRTRFLVKAKQLGSNLTFVDSLGRQHSGRKGDYLVESSEGVLCIHPRQIFEDIYVSMSHLDETEIGEEKIGEPRMDRLQIEALDIEGVKLRAPIGRPQITEARTVRHDEAVRARRKFPQPCPDRRASGRRVGLM